MVTSREALHANSERQFPVPPLEVPGAWIQDPGSPESSETVRQTRGNLRRAELGTIPAVELFVERARAADPGFVLTEQNAWAVAAICTALDGLPLAIELAAARTNLFTPQELQARLKSRLPMLTGGPRNLPPRQRTLRAAIDWSYNLLKEYERALFARLGIFVGGCDLAAVEAVCTLRHIRHIDVAKGLESLLDKNLLKPKTEVEVLSSRSEEMEGELRFTMVEMIREYAVERLAARDETTTIRRLHAEYYLAFAERAASQIESHEQALWLIRLGREHDNMRAALQWSQSPQGDPEIGLRLAVALASFWIIRGHFHEGRNLNLEEAINYSLASRL
jgi:predicted ATPase